MSNPMFTGVWPAIPTIFNDQGELDLDGQRRVVDFLVDAGVAGICILANYGEQFSLSDEERDVVQNTILEHLGSRLPAIATVSHLSAKITAQRAKQAVAEGAAMIMVMPPFYGVSMRFDLETVRGWLAEVAASAAVPLMLQDSPLSTTLLSADDIAALADAIPSLSYAKIETPRAAQKIRALKERASAQLPGIFDGEEGVTLLHDLDAGAVGSITSCVAPEIMSEIVTDYLDGRRASASEKWEAVLPLVQFENRQCGLNATKAVLRSGGIIASSMTRAPISPLSDVVESDLLALARSRQLLALRWGR